MKKLILCIAAVAMMLPSCKKINEELDALGNRIDKLENEAIPSIDEQIAAINTTLSNLDAMDKELKSYIDHLTAIQRISFFITVNFILLYLVSKINLLL